MLDKKCENCIYRSEMRQAHEIQKQSLCTRFPPSGFPMQVQGGMAIMSIRPPVNLDDTCGEFVPVAKPLKLV